MRTMRRRSRVPIALAALFFLVAAGAEIATSRSPVLQDDPEELVVTVDEAPARGERPAGLIRATF
jgi:hypothetical protein